MLNFGVFYQAGHKIVPCFLSLERFRKVYPTIPIIMYEDKGSNILEPVAKYFNCLYKRTEYKGENYEHYGKPVYNLESAIDWIDRIYYECNNTLRDVDWIMLYEDDVWVEREINGEPPYDLTGIPSYYIKKELKDHIGSTLNSNFGRGGSIFKRASFLEAYKIWKTIDWNLITNIDKTPIEWSDCTITFLFDYAKKNIGGWSELSHCNFSDPYSITNRDLWANTPQEVDPNVKNASIIHGYKAYYFPRQEEIDYINTKLCTII